MDQQELESACKEVLQWTTRLGKRSASPALRFPVLHGLLGDQFGGAPWKMALVVQLDLQIVLSKAALGLAGFVGS